MTLLLYLLISAVVALLALTIVALLVQGLALVNAERQVADGQRLIDALKQANAEKDAIHDEVLLQLHATRRRVEEWKALACLPHAIVSLDELLDEPEHGAATRH